MDFRQVTKLMGKIKKDLRKAMSSYHKPEFKYEFEDIFCFQKYFNFLENCSAMSDEDNECFIRTNSFIATVEKDLSRMTKLIILNTAGIS